MYTIYFKRCLGWFFKAEINTSSAVKLLLLFLVTVDILSTTLYSDQRKTRQVHKK